MRASSSVDFPAPVPDAGGMHSGTPPNDNDGGNIAPTLKITVAKARKIKANVEVTLLVSASDSDDIRSVKATVTDGRRKLASLPLKLNKKVYVVKKSVKSSAKQIWLVVTATDKAGYTDTKNKSVKIKK